MSDKAHHDPAAALDAKIVARAATVGVVGLGYVGLPMVRAMHEAGFGVVGYDVDEKKVEKLRRGEAYLKHLGADWVAGLSKSKKFSATADPADLAAADAVVICVPTPLGKHHEPDLSYVRKSTQMVAGTLHAGQVIILTSTSYPGTTREVCLPILEAAGDKKTLKHGRDYFVAFSPEREDPGRAGVTTKTIPRLVGGLEPVGAGLAQRLLAAAVEKVTLVSSAEVAEAAKLLENIYRAVNIALVNELKPVLTEMGIDIWEVIAAAATKPYGFQPFYPGPGLGGHCIPIDPYYLTWRAREFGHATRFIELAGEINSRMPRYVLDRTAAALNEDGKAVKGAGVLVIGLAYKPNVDDVRETPAAEVIRLLAESGARVSYHDPHVAKFPAMRKYSMDMKSAPLTAESLRAADCVVVITDHAAVDWGLVGREARLVVDTRNAMARAGGVGARVVKA